MFFSDTTKIEDNVQETYSNDTTSSAKSSKHSSSNNKYVNYMKSLGSKTLNSLQAIGKSIQFPIAVLPFAAILNRFGALGVAYSTSATAVSGSVMIGSLHVTNVVGYWISFIVQTPGAEMFSNLPLLFAIGLGFGLAKDNRGEAALASVAFFLVTNAMIAEHGLPEMIYGQGKIMPFTFDGKSYSELFYTPVYDANKNIIGKTYQLNTGVFGGVVAGCWVAFLYNRFKNINLPKALAFFSGRRFVPMLAIASAVPFAFAYAILWPWFQLGLFKAGSAIAGGDATKGAQVGGVVVFAILNRLMLAFGLHMILNALLWFQLPVTGHTVDPMFTWDWGKVSEGTTTVNGDISAFTGKVYGSGNFQSSWFPIMMGGLPAAVVAMIFAAPKANRTSVAGFLGGAAGISFLTGITEPIEYSFIFLAPVLLLVHAVYSGISAAIVTGMGMHVGFGFSAGFIDYAISFPQAWGFSLAAGYDLNNYGSGVVSHSAQVFSNPLWMLPLIAAFFALYFFTFLFLIKKLDIKTPGREDDYVAAPAKTTTKKSSPKQEKYMNMAKEIVEAVGLENIEVVDNCATRLRLTLKDNSTVDTKRIKETGVFGIKTLGTQNLQIIVGPDVEHVADAVHEITHK